MYLQGMDGLALILTPFEAVKVVVMSFPFGCMWGSWVVSIRFLLLGFGRSFGGSFLGVSVGLVYEVGGVEHSLPCSGAGVVDVFGVFGAGRFVLVDVLEVSATYVL